MELPGKSTRVLLKMHVKEFWDQGLTNQVEVRLGDGLSVLRRDEADVVVLAGMGGVLISSILSRGKDRIQGVERLVLQPNNNGDRVRAWLLENGWEIDGEDLVKERGVLYEIISARQGDPHFPYRGLPLTREQALELGPLLWRDRHPLLGEKVKEELLGLESDPGQPSIGTFTRGRQTERRAGCPAASMGGGTIMVVKGKDLIHVMEEWAPVSLAVENDRIGLQVGDPEAQVDGILLALDVTEEVVDEAIRIGANWIVAHHAVIFRPLKDLRSGHASRSSLFQTPQT